MGLKNLYSLDRFILHRHLIDEIVKSDWFHCILYMLNANYIYILITPYIRMLDSDWLIAVIFFTNSGLAL